nr:MULTISPECIES: SCP2 sterol-binding domain-containing protein [Marinobacter]
MPSRHHDKTTTQKGKTMSVAQVFEKLEQNFNADAAQGLDLVFQFDIEDDKTYHLVINDGTCKLHEGANDDPSVTLIMNSDTLQGIVSGETDGMQAFMAGQLRAEGDMMLATKLGELFKMG